MSASSHKYSVTRGSTRACGEGRLLLTSGPDGQQLGVLVFQNGESLFLGPVDSGAWPGFGKVRVGKLVAGRFRFLNRFGKAGKQASPKQDQVRGRKPLGFMKPLGYSAVPADFDSGCADEIAREFEGPHA